MNDIDRGLYSKYHVTKTDGTPLDGDCFVLRPDRDAAARCALKEYAYQTPNGELAADIEDWLDRIGEIDYTTREAERMQDASDRIEVAALCAENERLRAENAIYKADIEAGRLVRVPRKEVFSEAGNDMFMVFDGEIIKIMHCGARVDPDGNVWAMLSAEDKIFPYRTPDAEHDTDPTDWCRDWTTADATDFGKTIFPTEAEACAALGEEDT